ncbi:MAG: hypothetical protein RR632_02455 [Christensenella sp.]
MKKKLIALFITVIAAVTIFTGCGGAQDIKKPEATGTMVKITGSCKAELKGSTLTISGTSDIMDGTNGIISVLNSNGTRVAQQKITKQGDNLKAEFAVTEDWPQTVYGYIMFDTQKSDGQPAEVKKVYGDKFQNLEGEDIIWDKAGVIVIFGSEAVKIK